MSISEQNKQVLEKYGQNFCAAPFTSIYEGEKGFLSTCCKGKFAIGNSDVDTYEEAMNSDFIKKLRLDLLQNNRPDHCENCWQFEDTVGEVANPRGFNNAMAHAVLDDVIQNVDETGHLHKQNPVWIDLLSSNNCNFSCLGCKPNLSSSIAINYKKEFSILQGKEDYYNEFNDIWTNNNKPRIEYILKYSHAIKKIHLNGGEPFLNPDNFTLLDALIEHNLDKKIELWAHTNGSVLTYKGKNIVDHYFKSWGNLAWITMSNDGIGARGEFIRYGYNDKKWFKILALIKEANVNVNIQSCINIFNVNHIPEWGEVIYQEMIKNNISLLDASLDFWSDETLNFRLLGICEKTKLKTIKKLQKYLKSGNVPDGWKHTLESIVDTLHKDYNIEKYQVESLIKGIDALDKVRKVKFNETFPELNKLYSQGRSIIKETET